MLTNMHRTPTVEGNFCDKHGEAQKPVIVDKYNRHMDYTETEDRTANSYSIRWGTWKLTKHYVFTSCP